MVHSVFRTHICRSREALERTSQSRGPCDHEALGLNDENREFVMWPRATGSPVWPLPGQFLQITGISGWGHFSLARSALFTLGFGILVFVYLTEGQRCFQGMLEKSSSVSAFWWPSAMNLKEVIKLLYPPLRKSVFQLRGLTNAAPLSDKLNRWLWTKGSGWTVHAEAVSELALFT